MTEEVGGEYQTVNSRPTNLGDRPAHPDDEDRGTQHVDTVPDE